MSDPVVSAPGLPGATVIETSAQPAPSSPARVSDTTGMSESQAAAMRFVDANRAEAARDLGNVGPGSLNARINSALAHALHGEPAPSWLPKTEAAQAEAATQSERAVQEGDIPELAAGLAPMTEQDAAQLVTRGTIVSALPREIASEVVSFGREAQLPRGTVEAILDRLGAHADRGGGLGEVSPEDAPALAERCARLLGGQEKAEREITLARKYLHSVGGDKLLAQVDKRAGSLGFAPDLILQLSYLARVKGL
jgi:hypothetical protein